MNHQDIKYKDTAHGRRLPRGTGVVLRHRFNNNKSSIVWAYGPINCAWFVWREDGDYQALIRIHNEFESAEADFFSRVKFINKMQSSVN